ncbi:MAG: lipoprotein [Halofilum sp. (in: g-proteobacteria)]
MAIRAAAAVLVFVLLAACGQKGPLYLPEDESPEEST